LAAISGLKYKTIQVLLLTLWSFAICFYKVYNAGSNVVVLTYQEGSERLYSQQTPYSEPQKGDVYLYSPFFGTCYKIFYQFPLKIHTTIWVFLNCLVFWIGISYWFKFHFKMRWNEWLGLIFCSMELDGALRYAQINPLLVGTTLIGLSYFNQKKYKLSAFFLTLGANFKLLPGVFIFPLLFFRKNKFSFSVLLFSVLFFLIPALIVGLKNDFFFHIDYFNFLREKSKIRFLLDIERSFGHFGLHKVGTVVWWIVLIASPLAMILYKKVNSLWVSLGFCALLLINYRSEKPTFVFVAPVFLFLLNNPRRFVHYITIVSAFFITFVFNSLCPKAFKYYVYFGDENKSIGTLALWATALLLICLESDRFRNFIFHQTPLKRRQTLNK
jgi:hypothetical protein